MRGKLYERAVCAVLLGSRRCCLGPGQLWCVPGYGDRGEVPWASGWRALPSGRPGSVPGSGDVSNWASWGGMRLLCSTFGECRGVGCRPRGES